MKDIFINGKVSALLENAYLSLFDPLAGAKSALEAPEMPDGSSPTDLGDLAVLMGTTEPVAALYAKEMGLDLEWKVRRVRDVDYWGLPYGTPIEPGMRPKGPHAYPRWQAEHLRGKKPKSTKPKAPRRVRVEDPDWMKPDIQGATIPKGWKQHRRYTTGGDPVHLVSMHGEMSYEESMRYVQLQAPDVDGKKGVTVTVPEKYAHLVPWETIDRLNNKYPGAAADILFERPFSRYVAGDRIVAPNERWAAGARRIEVMSSGGAVTRMRPGMGAQISIDEDSLDMNALSDQGYPFRMHFSHDIDTEFHVAGAPDQATYNVVHEYGHAIDSQNINPERLAYSGYAAYASNILPQHEENYRLGVISAGLTPSRYARQSFLELYAESFAAFWFDNPDQKTRMQIAAEGVIDRFAETFHWVKTAAGDYALWVCDDFLNGKSRVFIEKLSNETKELKLVRHVRDAEFWHLPVGTPIVAGMRPQAPRVTRSKPDPIIADIQRLLKPPSDITPPPGISPNEVGFFHDHRGEWVTVHTYDGRRITGFLNRLTDFGIVLADHDEPVLFEDIDSYWVSSPAEIDRVRRTINADYFANNNLLDATVRITTNVGPITGRVEGTTPTHLTLRVSWGEHTDQIDVPYEDIRSVRPVSEANASAMHVSRITPGLIDTLVDNNLNARLTVVTRNSQVFVGNMDDVQGRTLYLTDDDGRSYTIDIDNIQEIASENTDRAYIVEGPPPIVTVPQFTSGISFVEREEPVSMARLSQINSRGEFEVLTRKGRVYKGTLDNFDNVSFTLWNREDDTTSPSINLGEVLAIRQSGAALVVKQPDSHEALKELKVKKNALKEIAKNDPAPADFQEMTPEERAVFIQAFEITTPDGMRTEVRHADRYEGRYEVNGVVYDKDGNNVGNWTRLLYFDREHPEMHNSYFSLQEFVQGHGLADAFYDQSESLMREQGIEQVSIQADISVGGYAWARRGFDWDQNYSIPSSILTRMQEPEYIDKMNMDKLAVINDEWLRWMQEFQDAYNAGDWDILPHPWELAAIGEDNPEAHWTYTTSGGVAIDMWPGKALMLHTNWYGRKPIDTMPRNARKSLMDSDYYRKLVALYDEAERLFVPGDGMEENPGDYNLHLPDLLLTYDSKETKGWNPLDHPRFPKGSGSHAGRFMSTDHPWRGWTIPEIVEIAKDEDSKEKYVNTWTRRIRRDEMSPLPEETIRQQLGEAWDRAHPSKKVKRYRPSVYKQSKNVLYRGIILDSNGNLTRDSSDQEVLKYLHPKQRGLYGYSWTTQPDEAEDFAVGENRLSYVWSLGMRPDHPVIGAVLEARVTYDPIDSDSPFVLRGFGEQQSLPPDPSRTETVLMHLFELAPGEEPRKRTFLRTITIPKKLVDENKSIRRVRNSRYWGLPVGTPITAAMKPKAPRVRHRPSVDWEYEGIYEVPGAVSKIENALGTEEQLRRFIEKHDEGSWCDDIARAVEARWQVPQVYGQLWMHDHWEPHSWNQNGSTIIDASPLEEPFELRILRPGDDGYDNYIYQGTDYESWKPLSEKSIIRHVRKPEYWHLPVGTPITPGMKPAAPGRKPTINASKPEIKPVSLENGDELKKNLWDPICDEAWTHYYEPFVRHLEQEYLGKEILRWPMGWQRPDEVDPDLAYIIQALPIGSKLMIRTRDGEIEFTKDDPEHDQWSAPRWFSQGSSIGITEGELLGVGSSRYNSPLSRDENATIELTKIGKIQAPNHNLHDHDTRRAAKALVMDTIADRLRDVDAKELAKAAELDPHDYGDVVLNPQDEVDKDVYVAIDNGRLKMHMGSPYSSDIAARPIADPLRWPENWHQAGSPEAAQDVRRAAVAKLINNWAGSANDDDPLALAIQEAARMEFGLDDAMEWGYRGAWEVEDDTGAFMKFSDEADAKGWAKDHSKNTLHTPIKTGDTITLRLYDQEFDSPVLGATTADGDLAYLYDLRNAEYYPWSEDQSPMKEGELGAYWFQEADFSAANARRVYDPVIIRSVVTSPEGNVEGYYVDEIIPHHSGDHLSKGIYWPIKNIRRVESTRVRSDAPISENDFNSVNLFGQAALHPTPDTLLAVNGAKADWKIDIPKVEWKVRDTLDSQVREETDNIVREHSVALRRFLRAQYENTQEWLKKHRITHVPLYRGQGKGPRHKTGERAEGIGVETGTLRPMSSFTTTPRKAEDFGRTRIFADYPAEDIVGMPATGVGCLQETEFVTLGKPMEYLYDTDFAISTEDMPRILREREMEWEPAWTGSEQMARQIADERQASERSPNVRWIVRQNSKGAWEVIRVFRMPRGHNAAH